MNKQQTYFWHDPEGEPILLPVSEQETIDLAVDITNNLFSSLKDFDAADADIDERALGRDANDAHTLLLVLLNQTNVAYSTVAEKLDYGSEKELLAATEDAESMVGEDFILHRLFAIAKDRVKRQFPAEEVTPKVVKKPAMSINDRGLFEEFRTKRSASSETIIHERYASLILQALEELGSDLPPEAIDVAWNIVVRHIRSADLQSPVHIDDAIYLALENELPEEFELRRVAELVSGMSVKSYVQKLDAHGEGIKTKQIKASLDNKKIEKFMSSAEEHLAYRLNPDTELSIPRLSRIPPLEQEAATRQIAKKYIADVKRYLLLSVSMREELMSQPGASEKNDFHLAQLPSDKLCTFFNITLNKIAAAEINWRIEKYKTKK